MNILKFLVRRPQEMGTFAPQKRYTVKIRLRERMYFKRFRAKQSMRGQSTEVSGTPKDFLAGSDKLFNCNFAHAVLLWPLLKNCVLDLSPHLNGLQNISYDPPIENWTIYIYGECL